MQLLTAFVCLDRQMTGGMGMMTRGETRSSGTGRRRSSRRRWSATSPPSTQVTIVP